MPNATAVPYNRLKDPLHLYGYIPTEWVCITILCLFGVTTVLHLAEAVLIKPRTWWLIPTAATCGVGEILGWSGRLWDSRNPLNRNGYLMQIATTIIAPVFLTAAMYTILGIIIEMIGTEYSRIGPKTYLKIFVTADIIALIVQAAGGAIASVANTDSLTNTGGHIMLAGIFLQMFTMIGYTALGAEFLLRFFLQKPLAPRPQSPEMSEAGAVLEDAKAPTAARGTWLPPRLSLMVLGLALSTLFVFVRTGYRTVELIGGWRGHIVRTQVYFNTLDATPIILALFTLNFLSPTFLLRT